MQTEALRLRQMMKCRTGPANVLAIASGKGGVGKTCIAANLGTCLAASYRKVLLIEGDMSLGNIDVILNISSKYNLWHMLSGRKSLEEIIHVTPEGLEVICGVSGLEQLANLNEFQRRRLLNDLSRLQENADVIIIDTASGISKSAIGFCLAADDVLVVTTPEAPAITDAYATIKVLAGNRFAGRISLIVNMAEAIAQGKKTYQQIARVAKRFLDVHVYDAGVLLRDERMIAAVRLRKPVVLAYPKAQISMSLTALAAKLGNGLATLPSGRRFFKKVVDWFF